MNKFIFVRGHPELSMFSSTNKTVVGFSPYTFSPSCDQEQTKNFTRVVQSDSFSEEFINFLFLIINIYSYKYKESMNWKLP